MDGENSMGEQGLPAVCAGPALEQMEVPGRKHSLWTSWARAEEENEREKSLCNLTATLSCTACPVVRGLGGTFSGNKKGRTGPGMRSGNEKGKRKGCFPLRVNNCLSDSHYLK